MTTNTDTDAWQRLGAMLIQRRTALNPRYHNRNAFCDATGLKYRLVYDIEEARRTNFGGSTRAAIEAAYQLAPGAIARFLAGADLEPQPAPDGDQFPATPAEEKALTPHLADVEARFADAARRLPPGTLTGRMVFPEAENERYAETWDMLVRLGYDMETVTRLAAYAMQKDREAAAAAERAAHGGTASLVRGNSARSRPFVTAS